MSLKQRINNGFQIIHDIFKLRWIPEILGAMASGATTYNDILKSIDGLSNTELNRKLAVLMEKKAVMRLPSENRHIYVLTDFGNELEHIFSHFEQISLRYFEMDKDRV